MPKLKCNSVSKNAAGYHLFFKEERTKIIAKEGSRRGFTKQEMLGVAKKWRKMDTVSRAHYEIQAKDNLNSKLKKTETTQDLHHSGCHGSNENKKTYRFGCEHDFDASEPADPVGSQFNNVSTAASFSTLNERQSLYDACFYKERRDLPKTASAHDPQDTKVLVANDSIYLSGIMKQCPLIPDKISSTAQDALANQQLNAIFKTIGELGTYRDDDLVSFLQEHFP